MKKFVVWHKYFNNGKVKAGIKEIEEQEVEQFIDFKEMESYNLYNDVFDTKEEAKKFYQQALKVNLTECPFCIINNE
jgi:hypothetical protein